MDMDVKALKEIIKQCRMNNSLEAIALEAERELEEFLERIRQFEMDRMVRDEYD